MLWLPGYFVDVEMLSTSPSGCENNDITGVILLEQWHARSLILRVVAKVDIVPFNNDIRDPPLLETSADGINRVC